MKTTIEHLSNLNNIEKNALFNTLYNLDRDKAFDVLLSDNDFIFDDKTFKRVLIYSNYNTLIGKYSKLNNHVDFLISRNDFVEKMVYRLDNDIIMKVFKTIISSIKDDEIRNAFIKKCLELVSNKLHLYKVDEIVDYEVIKKSIITSNMSLDKIVYYIKTESFIKNITLNIFHTTPELLLTLVKNVDKISKLSLHINGNSSFKKICKEELNLNEYYLIINIIRNKLSIDEVVIIQLSYYLSNFLSEKDKEIVIGGFKDSVNFQLISFENLKYLKVPKRTKFTIKTLKYNYDVEEGSIEYDILKENFISLYENDKLSFVNGFHSSLPWFQGMIKDLIINCENEYYDDKLINLLYLPENTIEEIDLNKIRNVKAMSRFVTDCNTLVRYLSITNLKDVQKRLYNYKRGWCSVTPTISYKQFRFLINNNLGIDLINDFFPFIKFDDEDFISNMKNEDVVFLTMYANDFNLSYDFEKKLNNWYE